MTRRRPALLLVGPLVALLAAAGCGDDDPASAPADCTRIEDGQQTLVARNLAWDEDCLRVPAGTEITFTVDLQDASVDHNLHVFGPSGEAKTPLERGPRTQTLVYDASTAGFHQFVCDIHPTMEGDLWVDPAG